MVRINKTSRSRLFEKNSHLQSRLLNPRFVNLILVIIFGTVVSLFYYLLSIERAGEKAISMQVAAHSASKIISSGKPYLVYGTAWKKDKTAEYVQAAVKSGFRFIDTACQPKHYNEAGVGEGWTAAAAEMQLSRSDLYLQTKFTPYSGQDPQRLPYDPDSPLEEQVKHSLQVSLINLKTDYLDALVLHSPLDTFEDTLHVWREMERFVDEGSVVRLGISNCYDYKFFKALYEEARIKPSILQNRFYAESDFDTKLRAFCKEHGITYQSFWTLTANRQALALPAVQQWAETKKLSPQTLMYAFLMSLGYIHPLSGTTSAEHMAEDVAVMERLQGGETIFSSEEELRRFAETLGMPDL